MELLKKVTLEINKEINRKIKAKQNDTARYLLFTIVDNGVPFSLQGKEVKVFAVKPDGKLVYNTCQITNSTNGETKLNLTSQMLAVPGTLKAELVISERNEIISTIPFEIEVIKSLRDDRAIESTNEFTILFSKIEEGKSLEVSLSELIEEGLPLYNKLNPVVEVGKELNTSLPPKTSEADRILKQLLQAIQNGNLDNFMSKTPTRYDRKDLNTITDPGRCVCANCTNAPAIYGRMDVLVWNEHKTAKWVTQIFYVDTRNEVFTRCSTNADATAWTSWAMMYSTVNKPTPADIGAVNINTGIGENLSTRSYTDLDKLNKTCFGYIASSAVGKPTGQDHAILQMTYDNELWKTQLAHDWRTNILYTRAKKNGSWLDWAELYSTVNKPSPLDIGAFSTTGGTITGYTKFETEYIDIGIGEEKLIRIGVGPTDMYICNLKTNKYLQLKDTGILSYSNKEICDKGHFLANIGVTGYQMLPSGLCLQWGYVDMGSSSTKVVNFPKAFVDNNYNFHVSPYGGPGRVPNAKGYYANNSNISIQCEAGFGVYWEAKGRV
ncbi:BppU family phage baseplate upper protein [Clostridium baratii]|uniref:BppU family phage baseplate upper protein n=1 Tax=Clostridium baratii TaxID=1561 RepID=UPI0030D574D4